MSATSGLGLRNGRSEDGWRHEKELVQYHMIGHSVKGLVMSYENEDENENINEDEDENDEWLSIRKARNFKA